MQIEYERGVIVDEEGFFLGAVKWEKGTPAPDLKTARGDGTNAYRLRLLTEAEAIENPNPNGRWDFKAKKWIAPDVPIWIVNRRRDKPIGTLAGSRMIFAGRPPRVADYQEIITTPPPEMRRGRKPIYDFTTNEWISPVTVATFDDAGVCTNVIVKERLEGGDEEPFEVENELGRRAPISPGEPRDGGHPARYRSVPVRFLRRSLQERNLLQPFVQFLEGKGFTADDFDRLETISLNNKLLREFVTAQGFTIQQVYNALQRDAEQRQEQELEKRRQLAAQE